MAAPTHDLGELVDIDTSSSITDFFSIPFEDLLPDQPDQLPADPFNEAAPSASPTPLLNLASSPMASTRESLSNPSVLSESIAISDSNALPPKIGARFSRESIQVLNQWLSLHSHHPFPSDKDKDMLQRRTGLNKTQVTTWLSNARRRRKTPAVRRSKPSRSVSAGSNPIGIPNRPGTPAVHFESGQDDQSADPLKRWVDSPPESEPATVTAIAHAVILTRSELSGANNQRDLIDDESSQSLYNTSSASSAGTSSDGSLASSCSNTSGESLKALLRGRQRRRRRPARTSLTNQFSKYQCTFCTETFAHKYDWQRHEKSLHLPLERWVCTPHAARVVNPENGQTCCIFCGAVEPSDAHIEGHNPLACQERVFNRKDHLKQHLRLVHNAGLLEWTTGLWKAALPEIRSRCGFCGISMDTWAFRAGHLADHFKMGQTMAAWKGDWGFEDFVVGLVENSIPPYLIDMERNTPWPFAASRPPAESPRNAYELLSLELVYFLRNFYDKMGTLPDNEAVQLEACRIIFAAEVSLPDVSDPGCSSWLRDLITSREDIAGQAQFGPIRSRNECRLSHLKINGQSHLFAACRLEFQLCAFTQAKLAAGSVTVEDHELQEEACKIVEVMHSDQTTQPIDFVANWLVKLICSSKDWLSKFRQRNGLPLVGVLGGTPTHAHNELERVMPMHTSAQVTCLPDSASASVMVPLEERYKLPEVEDDHRPEWIRMTLSFLNDANFDRWLTRELRRWVTATMSPNNPNCHVPTDEELQHQARCILYDDDDPWNQTAADNIEWLRRFKRDIGIIQKPDSTDMNSSISVSPLQDKTLGSVQSTSPRLLQGRPRESPPIGSLNRIGSSSAD